jgi:hypothetical protein
MGCRRDLRRLRYTRVDMSVGTWTLEVTTSWVMNSSSEGSPPSSLRTGLGAGDLGGVGGSCCVRELRASAVGGGIMVGSHWMTLKAALAK